MESIKTKDGYQIVPGMWLSDTDGVYEVKEIDWQFVYMREIIFDEDDPEKFEFGNSRRLTFAEARKLSYT